MEEENVCGENSDDEGRKSQTISFLQGRERKN
jgi:hypothetical protein